MKIYLLRHGETDWSKEGRLQGHTDIPMNEKGIEQIKDAGDFLIRTGEIIDIIITSPLIRAKRSAEIIADKIGYDKKDIIVEQGFIERCFGLGEDLTKEERNAKFSGKGYPNVESVEDLCERAGIAITKYINEYFDKTILIAAHGSILKAILVSIMKEKYAYNEGSAAFGTGEFCILEYNQENFEIISKK